MLHPSSLCCQVVAPAPPSDVVVAQHKRPIAREWTSLPPINVGFPSFADREVAVSMVHEPVVGSRHRFPHIQELLQQQPPPADNYSSPTMVRPSGFDRKPPPLPILPSPRELGFQALPSSFPDPPAAGFQGDSSSSSSLAESGSTPASFAGDSYLSAKSSQEGAAVGLAHPPPFSPGSESSPRYAPPFVPSSSGLPGASHGGLASKVGVALRQPVAPVVHRSQSQSITNGTQSLAPIRSAFHPVNHQSSIQNDSRASLSMSRRSESSSTEQDRDDLAAHHHSSGDEEDQKELDRQERRRLTNRLASKRYRYRKKLRRQMLDTQQQKPIAAAPAMVMTMMPPARLPSVIAILDGPTTHGPSPPVLLHHTVQHQPPPPSLPPHSQHHSQHPQYHLHQPPYPSPHRHAPPQPHYYPVVCASQYHPPAPPLAPVAPPSGVPMNAYPTPSQDGFVGMPMMPMLASSTTARTMTAINNLPPLSQNYNYSQ